MKRQCLLLFSLLFFVLGFNATSIGQDIKKGETKNAVAKVQEATDVSIFQIRFEDISERLQSFLTKNEAVLHFRGEANTGVYIIYLEAGKSKTDLSDLLKSNRINQYEIMKFQQGARKANLFNKRL